MPGHASGAPAKFKCGPEKEKRNMLVAKDTESKGLTKIMTTVKTHLVEVGIALDCSYRAMG
jgi:hypothetical protein